MKVFLSYSNLDKNLAGHIKSALEDYGLEIFLAHEDIKPLANWPDVIYDELKACDVFIPILTDNFNNSDWTDQETGIAIAHNKLIVPLKITVDPYGFISSLQALKIDIKKIVPSCYKIAKVIASKPGFGDLFRNVLIKKFGDSQNYANAHHNTELIVSFNGYTLTQVHNIIKHSIANRQINESFKARRKIRNFIGKYEAKIDPKLLDAFYEAIKH